MGTYVCSVCNPGRNDTRYKTIIRGDKKISVYLPPKGDVKVILCPYDYVGKIHLIIYRGEINCSGCIHGREN